MALKKLLDENDSLRNSLEEVQNKMRLLPPTQGVIPLRSRNIELRVVDYTGYHIINAWINDPKNFCWRNIPLALRNRDLGFSLDSVFKAHAEAADGWERILFASPEFEIKRGAVVRIADQAVKEHFERYLKEKAALSAPEFVRAQLNAQLGTGPLHYIDFVPTPRVADSSGKWSIRVQLVLHLEGKEETLKEFSYSSDLYPNHPLGKALPKTRMYVMVKG